MGCGSALYRDSQSRRGEQPNEEVSHACTARVRGRYINRSQGRGCGPGLKPKILGGLVAAAEGAGAFVPLVGVRLQSCHDPSAAWAGAHKPSAEKKPAHFGRDDGLAGFAHKLALPVQAGSWRLAQAGLSLGMTEEEAEKGKGAPTWEGRCALLN
jgi:hypothetical protein